MANLSLIHAVQTDRLEQTEQFTIRELQAAHNPPCRVKPELQAVHTDTLEHIVQLGINELHN